MGNDDTKIETGNKNVEKHASNLFVATCDVMGTMSMVSINTAQFAMYLNRKLDQKLNVATSNPSSVNQA